MALMSGTHQHRWSNDGSGICEKCHKEHTPHTYSINHPGICNICGAEGKCQHEKGFSKGTLEGHKCYICYIYLPHTKKILAEEDRCCICEECNRVWNTHNFLNGVCSVCGWICPHLKNTSQGDEFHSCDKCGIIREHNLEIAGTISACKKCTECDYKTKHVGITGLNQTCEICGYYHSSHSWNSGHCTICNYKCPHDEINSLGNCTVCGLKMIINGASIYGYGSSGGYDGSYKLYDTLNYKDGDRCKIYKGYTWKNNQWTLNGYKLFLFEVWRNITQFGGEYAYKITGYVFSKNDSINVDPNLLTKNGVRNLRIAQYNLDGSLRDSDITGYTSKDCQFVSSQGMNDIIPWEP